MNAVAMTAEERVSLLEQTFRSILTVIERPCADYEARVHIELLTRRALGMPSDLAEAELNSLEANPPVVVKPIFADEDTRPFHNTGMLTRAFISSDPVLNVNEFSLFTDDGAGNGEHVFSVLLADLERVVAQWRERRGA